MKAPSLTVKQMGNFLDRISPEPTSGCWLWIGTVNQKEYGTFRIGLGRRGHVQLFLAHRLSYVLFKGEIPEGLSLDHLCRVHCCINPDHLEPVTSAVNTLRGQTITAFNVAKTVCNSGHLLSGDNLIIRPGGNRDCRACHRAACLRYLDRTQPGRREHNGKKTHCVRGHELSGANLAPDALGRRICWECRRTRNFRKPNPVSLPANPASSPNGQQPDPR
jgi:hypothetical protein